jgi:predicted dehydrogenase
MVTVGVIGLGSMGKNHLRVLSNMDGVDEVVVFDTDASLEGLRFGRLVGSLDEVVAARPHYCVISTPSLDHLRTATVLIDERIPFLVEKPVAGTLADARQVMELAAAVPGLATGVGHVERFNPAAFELWHRIREGVVGDVIAVSTARRGPEPVRWIDTGVTTDLAVHDIDLTRWITGSEYATLSAVGSGGARSDHESLVRITAKLDSGIIVDHSVDWMTPVKVREVTVLGTVGMLSANLLTADLTFYGKGEYDIRWPQLAQLRGGAEGVITRYALQKVEPLRLEHEAMLRKVAGEDGDPMAELIDGVLAMEAVARVLEELQPG